MLSNLIKQVVNAKAVRNVITKIFMSYVKELNSNEEDIALLLTKKTGQALRISLIHENKPIKNISDNEIEERI